MRILEQWLRDHPDAGELPAVLPIVVYHGDRPWTSPRSPRDLVDWSLCAPALAAYLAPLQLHLPYLLLDLSSYDEQRIDDMRLSAVSSLTLRFLHFLRSCPPARVRDYIRAWATLVGFLTTHPRGRHERRRGRRRRVSRLQCSHRDHTRRLAPIRASRT